jgi:3-oxoacyl-[acyl-carrier protein] reductase
MTERDAPLAGRRAWVSGGSRGIGRACALELAAMGAAVTIASRDRDTLDSVVRDLEAAGAPSTGAHRRVAVDFTKAGAVWEHVQQELDQGGPIHILINNGGGPPAGAITAAASSDFVGWFEQHLIVNHLLAQAILPGMRAAGYGRIINIISTSVRQPIPGLGVSNTIRGAVASWSKTLAREVAADGITVNNILPGATETDRLTQLIRNRASATGIPETQVADAMRKQIPAGRFGRPEEIGAAAGFLAGPTAGYITGVSLAVDGGRTECL